MSARYSVVFKLLIGRSGRPSSWIERLLDSSLFNCRPATTRARGEGAPIESDRL